VGVEVFLFMGKRLRVSQLKTSSNLRPWRGHAHRGSTESEHGQAFSVDWEEEE